MEKTKTKTIIIIILIIGYSIFYINKLYNKYKSNRTDDIITTEETIPLTTTTIETTTTKNTTKYKSNTKQEYLNYAKEYGNLNNTQLTCLDYLWTHESNWNPNDVNKSSGACGIPQAYPCKKIIQSEGSNDWKAQIRWGIKYISNRYKNPCAAWNHFKNKKWY